MTRTRLVKGTITERTGGNEIYYAEGNIVLNAGKSINITSVDGISFGEPENPPPPIIIAKCMVNFRPHDKYNGEYGFDWLRAGDTGHKGDVWFGTIMGKYFEKDNVTIFQDGNSWNNNFKKDIKMYDRLLRSYICFSIPWKKKKREASFLYTIPTLTILKGKSATLNLKIEIEEKPKKITLEFKDKNATKFLDLSINEIGDIREGKYEKHNYLKITCKDVFDKEQYVIVKADNITCGSLRILPNSSSFRKNINVVFVKVKTDINSVEKIGKPITGGKDFFIQCLNQAYVIPTVTEAIIDCKGSEFKKSFCTTNKSGFKVTKSSGMRNYLESKLKSQFGNKFSGYYTVFFIGDQADWNGFSYYKSKFGVYFSTHNKATIAHETFHAMELAHTFNGIDSTANYTYEAMKTDNIMDYSHNASPPIDRKVLYLWQWKILNTSIKLK